MIGNGNYVITAGPSAGKTSTMNELSSRGYHTVPEAARLHIDEQISRGRDEEDILNGDDFQSTIIEIDKKLEKNLRSDEAVFMDRSLVDNIAYVRYFGDRDVENGIVHDILSMGEDRYRRIFLLDRLEFSTDYARQENSQQAEELHEEIEQAYIDAGYDPVTVPVMPIYERVKFILGEIDTEKKSLFDGNVDRFFSDE